MKKALIAIAILAGVVAVLFVAGAVYAQDTQPQNPGENGRSRFGMRGLEAGLLPGKGVIHTYMVEALASELNMTADELQTRLDAGDRVIDIAIEQGLSLAEFRDLMQNTRLTAIDNALADGVITQEQADWLKARPAFGRGFGRGMHGGFGGNCPGMTPQE